MSDTTRLHEWLQKLNEVVDPDHINRSKDLQLRALNYEEVERLPTQVHWPASDWPTFPYREAFYDNEKMLLNELAAAWIGANCRDDRIYTIRANCGVGIVPSLLGCEIKLMEDNQMPWVEPLDDGQLDRVLSNGVPDMSSGLGSRVVEIEHFYMQTLSEYDNLARAVRVFCCDTQGPFDAAHLVMGHRIYTDVFDNPDLVHSVLDLVTDTIIEFSRLQRKIIGETDGYHHHSQHLLPGGVRVCDDSPTNLSAEMYREFCKPYNERVFEAFDGGWVHYCGGAKHMLPEVLSIKGIKGINFGNPEKQDAPTMFTAAAKARVPVIGWSRDLPEGITTGVTFAKFASNLEEARKLIGFEA